MIDANARKKGDLDTVARDCYSDQECLALLERMFPQGLGSEEVLRELAPEGWASSPLVAVFHPSVERLYEEALRVHRNIESLRPAERRGESPEPTLESVRASHRETAVEPGTECRELLAECLWDVFSDNHEVLAADGRLVALGSFRGSAALLAEFANQERGGRRYDYMDFFMGTIWVSGRADLTPAYVLIFRRLQSESLDWVYHFPRLHLVDMRPVLDALKEQGADEPDWAAYSPSEAFAAEQEEREHEADVQRLRDELDDAYRSAAEKAAAGPPPPTVQAYRLVYGRLPPGWPPCSSGEGH